MNEEPRSQQVERDEQQHLLPALAQPDELRWWELQLGVGLTSASDSLASLSSLWTTDDSRQER